MMNVAEIYDRAARRNGYNRRLPRESLPPKARMGYDQIAASAEELIASAKTIVPSLPTIHFDFFWEGTVNALVFKHDGEYFIAVNTGTVVLLHLIFARMLSDQQLLSHVGDPASESPDVPLLQRLIPDAERMYQSGDLLVCKPKTEERFLYAHALHDHAMRFLVGHEIAHITCGHVDYLTSGNGAAIFSEVGLTDSSATGFLERQAIEVEADTRAIFANLASIEDTVKYHGQLEAPWSINRHPTIPEMLFDCCFAVNTLFRVFGDKRMTGVEISGPYPPMPLRRQSLVSLMLGYSKHYWNEMYEESIKPEIKWAVSETELAYAAITGDEPSDEVRQNVFGDQTIMKSHLQQIIECMEGGLRERLKPFAYELPGNG
jgi:hypothetical protein